MVHYKLIYFNLRGKGELIRMIFKHAGIDYEDVRFEKSEWPKIKSETMFGQVPVLEVDGKPIAQSNAAARYLANKYGLAGQNEWEQALADMYVDCLTDIMTGIRTTVKQPDPVKQLEIYDKFLQDTIEPHLRTIEQHLEKNGTGFLVGNAITWADLGYYSFFEPLAERFGRPILSQYPHFNKLVQHVGNIPRIKEYVATRPKTEI